MDTAKNTTEQAAWQQSMMYLELAVSYLGPERTGHTAFSHIPTSCYGNKTSAVMSLMMYITTACERSPPQHH